MGFVENWTTGSNLACTYVQESDALSCLEALQATPRAQFTGIGIGATTVEGDEALVSLVGKVCAPTSAGKTTCRSNNDPSVGQPGHGGQAAFDAVYSKSALGKPIDAGALPCRKISGKWYISTESSQTQ